MKTDAQRAAKRVKNRVEATLLVPCSYVRVLRIAQSMQWHDFEQGWRRRFDDALYEALLEVAKVEGWS